MWEFMGVVDVHEDRQTLQNVMPDNDVRGKSPRDKNKDS